MQQESLFSAVRILVDLSLASFLLYRAIVLIRGTKSMHVVLGLMLLFFLTVTVRLLDLTVTSWLLEQVWLAGVLLFVIVFQPEIRQALAELGKRPLVAPFLAPRQIQFVDETAAALESLCKNRTGALIVLEQDTGLKNLVASGVPIYGEATRELLSAVFNPSSPLHDGALVIGSDGKILAARCIIPISEDSSPAKGYGVRHRAALSLAETSDAIVLVVSEQTGVLSMARNGRLNPNVELGAVMTELKALYRTKAKKGLLRKGVRGEGEVG